MKRAKCVWAVALAACLSMSFAGCDASMMAGMGAPGGGAGEDLAADMEMMPEGDAEEPKEDGGENGDTSVFFPQAGQLTAGAWNDNKNYEFFLGLFAPGGGEQGESDSASAGIFSARVGDDAWGMSVGGRVEVNVTGADEKPAAGATVTLKQGDRVLTSAKSNASGKAYLFPGKEAAEGYTLYAGYDALTQTEISAGEAYLPHSVTLGDSARAFSSIDLCFMIDTTGSMGDELRYVQSEVDDVISRVQAEFPQADIDLGLVFYRDEGDDYVTRAFDFTSDIAAQRKNLLAQSANGGGDYPEAVPEGLEEALGLSWRVDSCKILLPILDAPPHESVISSDQKNDIRAEWGKLVYRAADMGVAALPVAASGADELTQYLLRSMALITNGTYVFLTDDSGIGYGHEEPVVGEYTVEYLNSCLVRLICEQYDGGERPAVYYRQEVR